LVELRMLRLGRPVWRAVDATRAKPIRLV